MLRVHSLSLGAFGAARDGGLDLKGSDFPLFCAALFRQYGEVLARGRYHRLISPYEGDCAAWSFVSPDKSVCIAGFVLTHVRLYGPNQRLVLRGLDPDADYRERFSGRVFSGRQLTGFGIDVHLSLEYKSSLWIFEKI